MTSNNRLGLCAGLLCVTLIAAAALSSDFAFAATDNAPPQFPIRAFFSNAERAYFRLSEDGKTLGLMQPVAVDGSPRRLIRYWNRSIIADSAKYSARKPRSAKMLEV